MFWSGNARLSNADRVSIHCTGMTMGDYDSGADVITGTSHDSHLTHIASLAVFGLVL